MLHAMILNINADQIELTQIAIKALERTIPSTAANFKVEEERCFIMDGLLKAAKIDEEEIQLIAMQALAEVPTIAYKEIFGHI